MQFNLREAYGELRELHDRLCYLELGKLPEDEEWYKRGLQKGTSGIINLANTDCMSAWTTPVTI